MQIAGRTAPIGREARGLVLVVDDDELLREAVSGLLEPKGFLVESCADAVQALARLRAGFLPDVILLDLRLPGMDGWEFRVMQRGDERWRDIPVIALSGDASPQAAAIDAEAFLVKPPCHTRLLETVERLVQVAQRRSSGDREAELARLRDLGTMATGIAEQLAPTIESLLASLRLAERKAGDLELRIGGSDAFSLRGIRQLLQSAERKGERASAVLQGVSIFGQMAVHALQRRRRVLIAHSEPRLSALLREALREDHEVLLVCTGLQAKQALAEDNFDVCLYEFGLSDLHGIELYEQLLERQPEQAHRLVFLTSGNFGERERSFFAQRRPWQLRAPFRASDVRELIEAQWRSCH